jgi:putative transposase
MAIATRTQQRYDHRLRSLVKSTGNIALAMKYGVPRSTARSWLKQPDREVIALDIFTSDLTVLQQEVVRLQRRLARLKALLRLILVIVKLSGFNFDRCRLPDGATKKRLLRAIDRSRTHMLLRTILRVIGLSPARFHRWNQDRLCQLDDSVSCPKSSPHRLTVQEVSIIRKMAESPDYRHVNTGVLAKMAQRLGKVYASTASWYRLVRTHRWRGPRSRVYPTKQKCGIRAAKTNEIWHVDTTMIRLLDGNRAYLHAIIDNFSRRILAWNVAESFDPSITDKLFVRAFDGTQDSKPTLLVDGGIENFNSTVEQLVNADKIKRVLAQTEIQFSNSMIESWWRILKHQWLYLNTLDTAASVSKLTAFYVNQHNSHMPHSAFDGQTPDEMYFGTGATIPGELKSARTVALQRRKEGKSRAELQDDVAQFKPS